MSKHPQTDRTGPRKCSLFCLCWVFLREKLHFIHQLNRIPKTLGINLHAHASKVQPALLDSCIFFKSPSNQEQEKMHVSNCEWDTRRQNFKKRSLWQKKKTTKKKQTKFRAPTGGGLFKEQKQTLVKELTRRESKEEHKTKKK